MRPILLQLRHQYRGPGLPRNQCSHFRGSRDTFIGPTAGALHLAIVYSPEAFGANDLIGAGGQLRRKTAINMVTMTSNCYRRNLHPWERLSTPDWKQPVRPELHFRRSDRNARLA